MQNTAKTASRNESSFVNKQNCLSGSLVYQERSKIACRDNKYLYNKSSPLIKLNTVCPYYTMFPLDFPLKILKKADKKDKVLDPFCGRGTTLFAARLLGLSSVGIDSNPLAAAISAAKIALTSAEAVIELLSTILNEQNDPVAIPAGDFWAQCYHPETLRVICFLRERFILKCNTPEEVVLRAIMLGLLHGPLRKGAPAYFSNQMPRTYATKPLPALRYWQKHGLTQPPYVDVSDAIKRKTRYSLSSVPLNTNGEVYLGDARSTDDLITGRNIFNWVITSPPYFGMRTYRSDQWLRNWFMGDRDDVHYNREGQIKHGKGLYENDLSLVWYSVAKVCIPGAKLIIRFGSLSSEPVEAVSLLKRSLKISNAGWKILTIKDAGSANSGYRQSEQFNQNRGKAQPEFDLYARLEV